MREAESATPDRFTLSPSIWPRSKTSPSLSRRCGKTFGPIYGLVNNAGISFEGTLALMPNSQIEQLVRLNTLSPIVLTKYVVRSMMADGGGRIVNIASIIGFTGYSGLSVYAATKASLIGFTRSLAREVGRMGVNVNAVAPGFVDTEMTQGLTDEQREQIVRRSALRPSDGNRRRGQRGRVPAQRQGEKHHRHRAYGGRGQHGMTATHNETGAAAVPLPKPGSRALELTAPIARHPDRILPTVIEELRRAIRRRAGSAFRPGVPHLSRARGPLESICPMGARPGHCTKARPSAC